MMVKNNYQVLIEKIFLLTIIMSIFPFYAFCQKFKFKLFSPIITEEKDVPRYDLPEVLECIDGSKVNTAEIWEKKRRPEIISLFSTYMYGEIPNYVGKTKWELLKEENNVVRGKAIRKDVRIYPIKGNDSFKFDVQIYLPKTSSVAPAPIFLALSFHPNYTVYNDCTIDLSDFAKSNNKNEHVSMKGSKSSFWNLESIIERCVGSATFCYQDLVADSQEDFLDGFPSLFFNKGMGYPAPYEWGAISLWAYQMREVMNYIVTDHNIDSRKVIAIGHSRLGKAALWAGALDQRIAMVISNNSGCGGAAISRRSFGESIEAINQRFPHWFCGNFKQFNNRERYLPFDQHELIALIAPRPVYIASADEDWWSDPKGEFLGGKYASSVYHLYGKKGLECDSIPSVGEPQTDGSIGYHIRKGKHDMTLYDIEQYLDFADTHLKTDK